MSDLLDDDEFYNWSKGSVALDITKSGVTKFVERKWKDNICSWPKEEIEHLSVFLEDIHTKKFTLTIQRSSKPTFKAECKHDLCEKLAERIMPGNPKNIDLQCTRKPGNYPKGEDCYWELAKMYMKTNLEETTDQTCPDNTEATLVFKMMKNCHLFKSGDKYYDEIMKVRNSLMHSPTNKLTSKELDGYISVMKDFLRSVHEDECKICGPYNVKDTCNFQQQINTAFEEFEKVLAKKTPFERTKEDLKMMKIALEEQRRILESAKRNPDVSGLSSSTLDLILEANKKRTTEYTIFITKFETIYTYDSPDGRKKAYEDIVEGYQKKELEKIKKEEETKQKLDADKLENDERKIKEEVEKRVREEIDRMKNENDKKHQEEERRRKEEDEKLKREEEDRKRKEEERMKQEAERRKREEERKRLEEEKRRKEEKEKQQQEEERRQREANEQRKREEMEEDEKRRQRAVGVAATAGGAAVGGVAAGAAMGAPLGPLGVVVGGTIGALGALFSGGSDK